MSTVRTCILSSEQLARYEEWGFVQSIPVLTPQEVQHYRDRLEKTWVALGGRVARADGLHLCFRWAWELATHQRLLDCLEDLLGPNIILKHTRFFYKYGKSATWVGWHQDGITEHLTDGRAPAIWLGLTEATVENGCMWYIPGSHLGGLLPHRSNAPRYAASSSRTLGATLAIDSVRPPGHSCSNELPPRYDRADYSHHSTNGGLAYVRQQ